MGSMATTAAAERGSGKLDDLQKIVALCKRRGFVFASAEIYGGFANTSLPGAGLAQLVLPYSLGPIFGFHSSATGGDTISALWGGVGGFCANEERLDTSDIANTIRIAITDCLRMASARSLTRTAQASSRSQPHDHRIAPAPRAQAAT